MEVDGGARGLVGPQMLWFVLLASVLVAGPWLSFMMVEAGRVGETVRNMGLIVMGFFTYGFRAHPEISLDNPGTAEAALRRGGGDRDADLFRGGALGAVR